MGILIWFITCFLMIKSIIISNTLFKIYVFILNYHYLISLIINIKLLSFIIIFINYFY